MLEGIPHEGGGPDFVRPLRANHGQGRSFGQAAFGAAGLIQASLPIDTIHAFVIPAMPQGSQAPNVFPDAPSRMGFH